jgi:hypothetical protein
LDHCRRNAEGGPGIDVKGESMERKDLAAFSARTLLVLVLIVLLSPPFAHCNQPFEKVAHVDVQDLINYFTIDGDTAYFVTLGGIEVFDFTDPASPEKICHLACSPGYRIDVENGLAYVTLGGTSGVDIIDLRNTSECSVAGHYETTRNYVDVQVRGNYMYLVSRGMGLEVVDITDPSAPVALDSCFESGSYSQEWMGYSCVSLQGHYACVGQSEHGVKIIDISKPSALKEISTISIDKHVSNVGVLPDLLVVSATDKLYFYDLSDIQSPVKTSSLDGFSMLGYIAADNSKMVVYDDRLVGLDISDPGRPIVTGAFNRYTHQLLFHRGYLITAGSGIHVFSTNW